MPVFPRLQLLVLSSIVPVLIGLAIAWTVSRFADPTGDYEIHFKATADGSALFCGGKLDEVGEAQASVSLVDFRFVVSDVELIRYDGLVVSLALEQDGTWQRKNVAFIDLEDATARCGEGTPATRRVIRGTAPKGNYRGLRFKLGYPAGIDPADPQFTVLLRAGGMESDRAGMFTAVRIDLAATVTTSDDPTITTEPLRIALRMRSPACSISPASGRCGTADAIVVTLNDFQPERHVVVAEVAGLLARPLLSPGAATADRECDVTAIDPMCHEALRRLGFGVNAKAVPPELFFLVQARK